MNNLYKMLDKIESKVMDGMPIPLLPFTIINQDKLIELLDKVHTAIPEEIQIADQIMNKRDGIIEEAQRKGQAIIEEARHRAESLLTDSELLKAVRDEADRIRQQVVDELDMMRRQAQVDVEHARESAIEEARMLRIQADEYAESMLKTLADNLTNFQETTQNAQRQLGKLRADLSVKHQKQYQSLEQQQQNTQRAAANMLHQGAVSVNNPQSARARGLRRQDERLMPPQDVQAESLPTLH